MALTELGPTFVKLGQVLASRPDLVGTQIAEELKKLHSDVPAVDSKRIHQTLAAELGDRLATEIIDFDDTPMAAASIGQVHRARLADETEVVVKVQRPGVEPLIFRDIFIFRTLGTFVNAW